ncbi:conserved hypothetical protein [Tenacibaculum maritimum]|uniref:hypothetical protein n=1 Tax=Tenacibaculum maritimum TaxID=107401 RepID=UPI0012E53607|nr:hypothetical protein [Tenacibaculum maritimum]CAA0211093.1 conserved hypothetical protein [Tenacibaculum maritimum]CAA0227217.1 conserved hypothetical protein [Tenacibaculum maritimum]
MKLIELVKIFREDIPFETFCVNNSLNVDSEVIEIFMEKPLNINNELAFFEIEKTEGKTEYQSEGILYSNLFDFFFFQDAIEESKLEHNKSMNNYELTKKLFRYAIKDS